MGSGHICVRLAGPYTRHLTGSNSVFKCDRVLRARVGADRANLLVGKLCVRRGRPAAARNPQTVFECVALVPARRYQLQRVDAVRKLIAALMVDLKSRRDRSARDKPHGAVHEASKSATKAETVVSLRLMRPFDRFEGRRSPTRLRVWAANFDRTICRVNAQAPVRNCRDHIFVCRRSPFHAASLTGFSGKG
jgi:hypothetical protein